jgi:tetratricopeptide (TPR) repeat protein
LAARLLWKKQGNICYDRKQFDRAYECYSNGDITAGLEKIADKYNEVGRTTEAGNIYVKIAENYMKTANTDAVEKLGTENVKAMNFSLASRIYDKAGNMNKSKKYLAYHKFMELDLDSAKMLLTEVGELDLVKAIETNMKNLDNIKNNVMVLNDFVQNQPFVTMESDPETGKQRPAVKDENILIEYYKGIKDAIVETFHGISKSTLAITNPELKKMMIKHFQQYPAGTKILDPNTFAVRLQKSTAQVKDVYLK